MNIAIYCKAGGGFGYGHLNRSILLYNTLNPYYKIKLLINSEKKNNFCNIDYQFLNNDNNLFDYVQNYDINLVILDIRDTDKAFINQLQSKAVILSIDDLGNGANYSNISIQMLPTPKNLSIPANFKGIEYLLLNPELQKYKNKIKSKVITLTFGGEDPKNLSEKVFRLLKKMNLQYEIQIVLGPLYSHQSTFEDVKIIKNPDNFYKILSESEIIITSFGITVFEALSLEKKVITINPSDYHSDLADQVNSIINIGTWKEKNNTRINSELNYYLINENAFLKKKLYINGLEKITGIIQNMENIVQDKCPICNTLPKAILRKEYINYYHCESCKSFFRSSNYQYTESYNDDYFTSEYSSQYGKTYIEDKVNINKFNQTRLNIIKKLCPVTDNSELLEIGSAMGFFLEMAKSEGYQTQGVEISQYASEYAKKELGLDVFQGAFDDFTVEKNKFNVISAWFFIEHHKSYLKAIDTMIDMLKPGGILALSTPNAYGISFRNSPEDYVKRIPLDHYIEFSPISLSKALNDRGLIIEHIEIKGLHPSRLLKKYSLEKLNFSLLNRILRIYMARKQLGDTFEIYARKKN